MAEEIQEYKMNNIIIPDVSFTIKEELPNDDHDYLQKFDLSTAQIKTEPSFEVHDRIVHDNLKIEDETIVTDEIKIEYNKDLVQCQFCKIFLNGKEYLDCHITYCPKRSDRQGTNLPEENKCKAQTRLAYKCQQCNYKTAYKADLKEHANTHYEVKACKCGVCNRRFKTKESLKAHAEGKAEPKCTAEDSSETRTAVRRFRINRRTPQDETKLFRCTMCDFRASKKINLRNHKWRMHVKGFDFKCAVCGLETKRKDDLERHVKTIHLKEFKYKCDTCDFKTNQKAHLAFHVKTKHLNQFSYKCELCDYKSNYRRDFEKHLETKHGDDSNYKCGKCCFAADRKDSLARHVEEEHHDDFLFDCVQCEYKTNYRLNLDEHVRTAHLALYGYKCDICDYKSTYKQNVDEHTRLKHFKEFSFKCTLCDFRSNYKLNLQEHRKTEHGVDCALEWSSSLLLSGETETSRCIKSVVDIKANAALREFSYQCTLCPYKTDYKLNFGDHANTVHHRRPPAYECNLCDFRSIYKGELESHEKTQHLQEFNFKCRLCEFQTNYNLNLREHFKTYHFKQTQ